jgi:hypothetical protein
MLPFRKQKRQEIPIPSQVAEFLAEPRAFAGAEYHHAQNTLDRLDRSVYF